MVYICALCGFEYDEEKGAPALGIAPNTKWEDVEHFLCPHCDAGKREFLVKEA